MLYSLLTMVALILNVSFEGYLAYCGMFKQNNQVVELISTLTSHSKTSLFLWALPVAGLSISGAAAIFNGCKNAPQSTAATSLYGFLCYHVGLTAWAVQHRFEYPEIFPNVAIFHGVFALLTLAAVALPGKKRKVK
uniref:Uncharacterized protein n=1 Tax=Spongospora subterranea TaxID=70186 RepID=A0A0H5R561_9EUKA|eukprot:CRZ08942.1 hypothetical protein [Spongospora subterranea]